MAKVTGPLMSLSAAGSFGDTITFGKWKGIQYARIKSTPTNPNSVNQQAQRTLFQNAVAGWQALTEQVKGNWTARAAELGLKMSGFNLYTKSYIDQDVEPPDNPTMP